MHETRTNISLKALPFTPEKAAPEVRHVSMKVHNHPRTSGLAAVLVFLSISFTINSKVKIVAHASDAALPPSYFAATPYNSKAEIPSVLAPSTAPESLIPLLPSSPLYPFLPNDPITAPTMGLCNLNLSTSIRTLSRTAGDCTAPLAAYVGNVICCPQFESMLRIFQGELSVNSHMLVLNSTDARHCLSDVMNFLIDNGANDTIPELCNMQTLNLTGGACPVTTMQGFQQAVNTSKLLAACSYVDPLKECCKPVCQPAITDAAVRLASGVTSSLEANNTLTGTGLQHVIDDCEGVVLAWLASQLGAESANSAFRNLFSCKVNKACPLVFHNPSSVAQACKGSSVSNATCCSSLSGYISRIQQQMLITNVQALDCVTLFGSMLQRRGVTANVYDLCRIDLKDFSLQVFGAQGCLLRAITTDVVYDKSSGISFTCDLNDNIAAPWPSSSSLSSFPLCARSDSLPALPALKTSDCSRLQLFSFFISLLAGCYLFLSIYM